MGTQRVEQRLRDVTAALGKAGIPYAVIGGNAVNHWVATRNRYATVTTRDVDILVNRGDVDRVAATVTAIGFLRSDLRKLVMFVQPDEPDRRSGVHLHWAGERVRPSYVVPAPDTAESVDSGDGYRVIALGALVSMKLASFRTKDRVHLELLLSLGMIDESIRASLHPELASRLAEVERTMDEDDFAEDP